MCANAFPLTLTVVFFLFYSNSKARIATSVSAAEKSKALPFLPRPANLDGSLPGDYGFDPLGISNYIPVSYLRESELKHGRIAMLAWLGYVSVDLGFRIYPLPAEWEGLTSATAHDAVVAQGGMTQIFHFAAFLEMVSWIGISQMLQGSGREPGYFGFGVDYLKGKSAAEVERIKLSEVVHCRAAMFAFSGVVTQSVLYNCGFPYDNHL